MFGYSVHYDGVGMVSRTGPLDATDFPVVAVPSGFGHLLAVGIVAGCAVAATVVTIV